MAVVAHKLRRSAPPVLVLTAITLLAGARAAQHAMPPAPRMTVTSTAFTPGGGIPVEYTCDGPGVSPPLAWSGVPTNAKSLALIVDDPDAPDPAHPQMTWVHWVLYDLPPATTTLAKGASGSLPPGTKEGKNDWKRTGYGGPCPPVGRHRYFFKLYALDTVLPNLHAPTKAQLENAMKGHIVAHGELIGTYARSK
ncbi:MAG TPA: YbhB/YbcL family Raf kinase inhibitor-like protein [Gemmatimonadaceae bacterium]